jgi:hypothetical protein
MTQYPKHKSVGRTTPLAHVDSLADQVARQAMLIAQLTMDIAALDARVDVLLGHARHAAAKVDQGLQLINGGPRPADEGMTANEPRESLGADSWTPKR